MTFDPKYEIKEIMQAVKKADGFLDIEKAIMHNVRKHFRNGVHDKAITDLLQKVSDCFKKGIASDPVGSDNINYNHAIEFVNTLIRSL